MPEAAQPSRLGDALALVSLAALAWADLHKFADDFDALAYHLPFAARRTGLLAPGQFVLPPLLADRLAGFPPLADLLQGALWRGFGRPEAAALLAPLGVALFALYARAAFGVAMLWSVLIFAAVPILHTALDSAYVDLWTNALFAVHLLAAFRAVTGRARAARDSAFSMAALALAVWSKPQFCAVGAVSLALCAVLLWRRRARRALWVCAVLALPCFAWPLRNLLLFGSPFWPVVVNLGPLHLPGVQTNDWTGPDTLAHVPNAARWLLSQLDLDAVDSRPHGYSVDQGEKPMGAAGDRMGGSLSVLLLAALGILALALWRARPGADARAAMLAMLLLTTLVACLPGGNELRYFSFVNIIALFAALAVTRGSDLGTALRLLLVASAIHVALLTGGRHLLVRDQPRLIDLARAEAQQDGLPPAPAAVCYARGDFRGLLLSSVLLPGGAARVVEAIGRGGCPPGLPVFGQSSASAAASGASLSSGAGAAGTR